MLINEKVWYATVSMSNVLFNAAQNPKFPADWRESFRQAYTNFDTERDEMRVQQAATHQQSKPKSKTKRIKGTKA